MSEVTTSARVLSLADFIGQFGVDLLAAVRRQNPPIYQAADRSADRDAIMESFARKPFEAQRDAVQAVARLLIDEGDPAAVINAEMGTGKTMMGIATALLMHHAGYPRTLVISPPHLVYKWRREILETVPKARVWILNGPDTLRKLLSIRHSTAPAVPEFFVMGRVRMRMGFNWRPAFVVRCVQERDELGRRQVRYASCPRCGEIPTDDDGKPILASQAIGFFGQRRTSCKAHLRGTSQVCGEALWTLSRDQQRGRKSRHDLLRDAMMKIPTIGEKTAGKLLDLFGADMLSGMLEDNVHEFINLMDENGDLYFSDRQARRMERAMANTEFSFGQGGFQPSEFIKRYLPRGYFGLLLVDEGHEYKNEGSAQGQAMGVLAAACRKAVLLTGTLMGGYADDLFYLLFRLNPGLMVADGFGYNKRGLGAGAMAFMREHGVLKDIYKEAPSTSHRTAKGKSITHRTSKGPGFGPMGIMRYVLPMTVFLKLKDIGGNVLPPYQEHFVEVAMIETQAIAYRGLSAALKAELRQALVHGDTSLLGVVLNVLLAWPDCAFRGETVIHPHRNRTLACVPPIFGDNDRMPKEEKLLDICRAEKARGRRVLVYSTYTGTRDTTARLKRLLDEQHFKTAVLRASVDASKREDWLFEQVDRGVDIIITNPELVKTGLDMLEFPTIVFMQSGYNVYTLQQASRRSWRIGQRQPVDVYFLGYQESAQMSCLELMAKKIAVSQSTSGDMPESGLDVLNQSGDSIEVALAKQLLA